MPWGGLDCIPGERKGRRWVPCFLQQTRKIPLGAGSCYLLGVGGGAFECKEKSWFWEETHRALLSS